MFQNYFKIAFRNLIKERLLSAINVVGWSIVFSRMQIRWVRRSLYKLPILASLGLAWLALSYQSIRAALANPVKSLRSE